MAIIDVVKSSALSDSVLVEKFCGERPFELRLGSQLIVNQSQEAIFVKGGVALDTFGPGTHTLSTANIPLLSSLTSGIFGNTPFAAEVWFVNKTVKRDIPWGTPTRIPIMDSKFNFLINIGAFGQWGMRIDDSRSFVTQLVGTQLGADAKRIESYFQGEILEKLSSNLTKYIQEKKLSLVEINSKLTELSQLIREAISSEFSRFGIEIVNFNINNISIPQREMMILQNSMTKRLEIEALKDTQISQSYITAKSLEVMEKAAENNSGAAGGVIAGAMGIGVGMGAGLPLGRQMSQNMQIQASEQQEDYISKLKRLKSLFEQELITKEEYETKKKEILDNNF